VEPRYADRGRPVLVDAVSGVGAMAALVTALRALSPDAHAILLAVDVPLAGTDVLRHLVSLASGFDAAVPVSPAGAEPFCAVYAQTCLPAVERALSEGRFKMTAFWRDAKVREVTPAEIAPFGDPDRIFLNVNTRADYERARMLAGLDNP